MKIESTRFGKLEVAEEQVFNFPHGIPGFPDEKTFVHLHYEEGSPFSFLQSTTEGNLTFVLVDPFAFLPDYEFVLDDEIALEIGLSQQSPPQVFLIATVKGKLAEMTVNLLAPVVMNGVKRVGRQVILDKRDYSICHKLFPDGFPKEADKGVG
ncbi:flagellar assembly protein FliW [Desulfosporosinus sp. OT]|uniref:flagellar assembly protein FliW n=1 Tax=Desulfosporosinus sp. OT TaxID=913865 RepID=UPI000223A35B|nr:flagellar assembly protein FliW [Desulfosporosinus sp. OT]EGW36519.1 flagellar assembly factor fliW [Desulfosporosinus sp. OT]